MRYQAALRPDKIKPIKPLYPKSSPSPHSGAKQAPRGGRNEPDRAVPFPEQMSGFSPSPRRRSSKPRITKTRRGPTPANCVKRHPCPAPEHPSDTALIQSQLEPIPLVQRRYRKPNPLPKSYLPRQQWRFPKASREPAETAEKKPIGDRSRCFLSQRLRLRKSSFHFRELEINSCMRRLSNKLARGQLGNTPRQFTRLRCFSIFSNPRIRSILGQIFFKFRI